MSDTNGAPAPAQCYAGEHTTDFAGTKNMDQMKAMLANADPGEVESCAKGWMQVHNQLVEGSGSAKAIFDAAVEHITQHWEGPAAEGFKAEAATITNMITNCSAYAKYTSQAMTGAASILRVIKPQVDAMDKPDSVSSAVDRIGDGFDGFGRSDEQLRADLAAGMDTQSALERNRGSLSAGKEAQLEMAVRMEQLGANYNALTQTLNGWPKPPKPPYPPPGRHRVNDGDDYPSDADTLTPPVVVIPQEVTRPRPTDDRGGRIPGHTSNGTVNAVKDVTSPRDSGITGGVAKPPPSSKPSVGTAIDGIAGGTPGAGGYTGGTAGAGGGAGAGGAGGTAGAGGYAGGGAGVPGALGGLGGRGGTAGAGAAGRGGSAGAGASGRGGVSGVGAAGRGGSAGSGGSGAAGAAGRGGMPGMGGMGAGAGAGTGGPGTGRGGGMARRGGGVVGSPQGASRSGMHGTPGGSGLHRSRGAAGAAGAGSGAGQGANRMMGRGQTDRTAEEERREGERPDYLVEDEETWTPERNTAPRVIE